jgi:hypothetical protein
MSVSQISAEFPISRRFFQETPRIFSREKFPGKNRPAAEILSAKSVTSWTGFGTAQTG